VTGTPFQEDVWRALKEIPYGKTWTYKDIAEKIGRPKAVRAVGAAIGRNPISIIIPCHRVIATTGKLQGFAGGLDRKQTLLDIEA
ncbi:MAG: MGMT family protein, partial [Chlamydiales bacterium]|nr:MGMT family protein [Chlamydiales bacterium]